MLRLLRELPKAPMQGKNPRRYHETRSNVSEVEVYFKLLGEGFAIMINVFGVVTGPFFYRKGMPLFEFFFFSLSF
jgi:hypothetical protein